MGTRRVVRLSQFRGISRRHSILADSPEYLLSCRGFVVSPLGQLVTEFRWEPVPLNPIGSQLSAVSRYKVRAMLAYPREARTEPSTPDGRSGFYYLVFDDLTLAQPVTKIAKTVRATASGTPDWKIVHAFPRRAVDPVSMAVFNDRIYCTYHDDVAGAPNTGLYVDATAPPTPTSGFTGPIKLADGTTLRARFLVPHYDRLFAAVMEAHSSRMRFANPGGGAVNTDWPVLNYFDVESYSGTGIHGVISTPEALYIIKGVNVYGLYGFSPDTWQLRRLQMVLGQTYNPKFVGLYEPFSGLTYVIDPNSYEMYAIRGGRVVPIADQLAIHRFVGHTQEILSFFGEIDRYAWIAPQGEVAKSVPYWHMEGPETGPDLGFVVSLRDMSFTESLYLRPATGYYFWRAAAFDPNFRRTIIAADKPTDADPHRIWFLDSNLLGISQKLSTTQGLQAYFETRYLSFGSSKWFRPHEVWVRASCLQPYTGPAPIFQMKYRALAAGLGGQDPATIPYQLMHLADPSQDPEDATSTSIPADGRYHRLSLSAQDPTEPAPSRGSAKDVTGLAFRLEYNGDGRDLGIRFEELLVDIEDLGPEVL